MNRQMMGNQYPYNDPSMMGPIGGIVPPQYAHQQQGFQPPMMKQVPMRQPPMIPTQVPPYYQQQIQNTPIYQPPQALPPQQIILTRPNPAKEKYAWQPRTEPMKWQLAESIDVDQIVRKGDLNSVEFYMEQFTYANIQKDDLKQFGSKGALNAFLILQLGCDYLIAQRNQAPPPSTNEPDQKLLEQYNQNIKAASDSIMQHKAMIKKLQSQISQLKNDRTKEKAIIDKYRKKLKAMKEKLKDRPSRHTVTKTMTDTEPGALHDETAIKALQQADKKRKKLDKTDELSDGEISDSDSSELEDTKNDTSEEDEYSEGEASETIGEGSISDYSSEDI